MKTFLYAADDPHHGTLLEWSFQLHSVSEICKISHNNNHKRQRQCGSEQLYKDPDPDPQFWSVQRSQLQLQLSKQEHYLLYYPTNYILV